MFKISILVLRVKRERNIQQQYILNKRTGQGKHFDANFVQIGQGISEILTFEIFERSDFWRPF